jgi:hypothetical protein
MIFTRTPNVPQLDHYGLYRDPYLRPDFRYRCAYCTIHEFYFSQGDGGEIDHHRPLNPPRSIGQDFSHLRNDYSNLYWSCGKCNGTKGNRWPSDAEYADGQRFLDPCIEDHDDHWTVRPDGTIAATSTIGAYTIEGIRLNRRRLVGLRARLHGYQQRVIRLRSLLEQKSMEPWIRAELLRSLDDVLQMINPPVFEPETKLGRRRR